MIQGQIGRNVLKSVKIYRYIYKVILTETDKVCLFCSFFSYLFIQFSNKFLHIKIIVKTLTKVHVFFLLILFKPIIYFQELNVANIIEKTC